MKPNKPTKGKNETQYPCACGDENCQIGISFDGLRMYITDKKGSECLMYLDHNTAHKLIRKLKEEMIK